MQAQEGSGVSQPTTPKSSRFSFLSQNNTTTAASPGTSGSLTKWAVGAASSFYQQYTGASSPQGKMLKESSTWTSLQQELYATQAKQITALSKQVEDLKLNLQQREFEVEAAKEQQTILIELKDNILKAILQQNSEISAEVRDCIAI